MFGFTQIYARQANSVSHGARFKWKQQQQQQQQQKAYTAQRTTYIHPKQEWLRTAITTDCHLRNLCVSGEKETTNRRSKLINHFHFRFRWAVYSRLSLPLFLYRAVPIALCVFIWRWLCASEHSLCVFFFCSRVPLLVCVAATVVCRMFLFFSCSLHLLP